MADFVKYQLDDEAAVLPAFSFAWSRSDILPVSQEEIDAAREDVGGNMGW
jgi:hypothetical protein